MVSPKLYYLGTKQIGFKAKKATKGIHGEDMEEDPFREARDFMLAPLTTELVAKMMPVTMMKQSLVVRSPTVTKSIQITSVDVYKSAINLINLKTRDMFDGNKQEIFIDADC
jgi:hypothetical protein